MVRRFVFLFLLFAVACSSNKTSPVPVVKSEAGVAVIDPATITAGPSLITGDQQLLINTVAQKLLAYDEQQAIQVARSLRFAGGQEDPSNMCGPLSLYILRQAGIVASTTPLHSFWLLNPRVNRKLINEILPPNDFYDWRFKIPLNEFNFQTFPLQPGDFLYICAGKKWELRSHAGRESG
jgi:hypothetical protein